MQLVQQIGLQAIEILTLVFGILGITFSSLLLFAPNMTKSISKLFNRYVSIEDKVSYLDKDVKIDSLIYGHHMITGALLFAGSLFALIFFFFQLDVTSFANIFFVSREYLSMNEMIFNAAAWVGKIACFFGLGCGVLLFFIPDKMKRIESKVNIWFETRPIFKKLDSPNMEFDAVLFRHPVISGLIGLIVSFFIVVLSILNLLN